MAVRCEGITTSGKRCDPIGDDQGDRGVCGMTRMRNRIGENSRAKVEQHGPTNHEPASNWRWWT